MPTNAGAIQLLLNVTLYKIISLLFIYLQMSSTYETKSYLHKLLTPTLATTKVFFQGLICMVLRKIIICLGKR